MASHVGAPKTPKANRSPQGDRFIPKRSAMDGDMALFNLCNENANPQTPGSATKKTPSKDQYKNTLADSMGVSAMGSKPAKILTLQADAPKPPEGYLNAQRVMYSQNKVTDYKKKVAMRHIPTAPEKILDAPELKRARAHEGAPLRRRLARLEQRTERRV